MSKVFIDTSIIVYSQDRRFPKKQQRAIERIAELFNAGNGVVSTQVIQEYAATALTKLGQKPDVVLHILYLLENFEVMRQTLGMIRRAVELKSLYSIQFWDACIIANAEMTGCSIILTEDLNTTRFYSGIRVINPFA